jgi:hypothetical protein
MWEWVRSNELLLSWLGAASVLMFVGSLIAVPWVIVRLPSDYLANHRLPDRRRPANRLLGAVYFAVKNVLGIVLILAGIAMLVLPGQGILTIWVGLLLMDLPGKRAAERWLVGRRPVLASINWIRLKAGRPAMEEGGDRG